MEYRMYLITRRLKLKLSVNKVSQLTGITRQHYSRIECGHAGNKVSFRCMGLIASALAIPLDEMYKQEMEYLDSLETKHADEYWLGRTNKQIHPRLR